MELLLLLELSYVVTVCSMLDSCIFDNAFFWSSVLVLLFSFNADF